LPNDSLSALKVDRENVIVSAIKRSEDNKGIIIRLYETDGLDTEYAVSGKALPLPLSEKINAWSVDTWYLEDNSTEWQKVDFTEIR
jgi:alpha-mannosidase